VPHFRSSGSHAWLNLILWQNSVAIQTAGSLRYDSINFLTGELRENLYTLRFRFSGSDFLIADDWPS
jgi:hypothetical protein